MTDRFSQLVNTFHQTQERKEQEQEAAARAKEQEQEAAARAKEQEQEAAARAAEAERLAREKTEQLIRQRYEFKNQVEENGIQHFAEVFFSELAAFLGLSDKVGTDIVLEESENKKSFIAILEPSLKPKPTSLNFKIKLKISGRTFDQAFQIVRIEGLNKNAQRFVLKMTRNEEFKEFEQDLGFALFDSDKFGYEMDKESWKPIYEEIFARLKAKISR